MNGYKITITETYSETYYIKADTQTAAEDLAKWNFGCEMAENHELLCENQDVEIEKADEPEDEWLVAEEEEINNISVPLYYYEDDETGEKVYDSESIIQELGKRFKQLTGKTLDY